MFRIVKSIETERLVVTQSWESLRGNTGIETAFVFEIMKTL